MGIILPLPQLLTTVLWMIEQDRARRRLKTKFFGFGRMLTDGATNKRKGEYVIPHTQYQIWAFHVTEVPFIHQEDSLLQTKNEATSCLRVFWSMRQTPVIPLLPRDVWIGIWWRASQHSAVILLYSSAVLTSSWISSDKLLWACSNGWEEGMSKNIPCWYLPSTAAGQQPLLRDVELSRFICIILVFFNKYEKEKWD